MQDGSVLVNQITGDSNCDLRIYQTDIAPYPTKDPFGNSIRMRPEMDSDRCFVSAYHSTEGTLLVALLKYISQEGIEADFLKDNAGKLIEYTRSLGQHGGTCTEHFGGFDQRPKDFFFGYPYPMPKLDAENKTSEWPQFPLLTATGGHYNIYIAHNRDLAFSYVGEGAPENPVKGINLRFQKEDVDHIATGLCYQSAMGLGRTSARQLISILEYRFSSGFDEEMKKHVK